MHSLKQRIGEILLVFTDQLSVICDTGADIALLDFKCVAEGASRIIGSRHACIAVGGCWHLSNAQPPPTQCKQSSSGRAAVAVHC